MTRAAASTALGIEGLQLARDGRPVLRGVSVTLGAGEVCALMGVSGAGKSTLLRAAVALEPFDAGVVRVGDVALRPGPLPAESALRAFRRRIGMVFQQHALFSHLTIRENVALAPVHVARLSPRDADARAMQLLESLGVGDRADAYPSQVSGGQAQRVAIARALALDPQVLLMDEPTAALDPARRAGGFAAHAGRRGARSPHHDARSRLCARRGRPGDRAGRRCGGGAGAGARRAERAHPRGHTRAAGPVARAGSRGPAPQVACGRTRTPEE